MWSYEGKPSMRSVRSALRHRVTNRSTPTLKPYKPYKPYILTTLQGLSHAIHDKPKPLNPAPSLHPKVYTLKLGIPRLLDPKL